jgi:hypothetical protein
MMVANNDFGVEFEKAAGILNIEGNLKLANRFAREENRPSFNYALSKFREEEYFPFVHRVTENWNKPVRSKRIIANAVFGELEEPNLLYQCVIQDWLGESISDAGKTFLGRIDRVRRASNDYMVAGTQFWAGVAQAVKNRAEQEDVEMMEAILNGQFRTRILEDIFDSCASAKSFMEIEVDLQVSYHPAMLSRFAYIGELIERDELPKGVNKRTNEEIYDFNKKLVGVDQLFKKLEIILKDSKMHRISQVFDLV